LAAGITLAGFTAVSVNENWQAAFIESTAGAIHKVLYAVLSYHLLLIIGAQLANLQSLAVYFDTDSPSMAGLLPVDAIKKFSAMVKISLQLSPCHLSDQIV
jgi:Vacuolar protein sorting-associated protein